MFTVLVVPSRGTAFYATEHRRTRLFVTRDAMEAEAYADLWWRGTANTLRALVVEVGDPDDRYCLATAMVGAMATAARAELAGVGDGA